MTSSNGDRSVFNSDWDQYIDGWDGVTGQAPAVLSVYLQAHSSGFTSVAQSVSVEIPSLSSRSRTRKVVPVVV